MKTLITKILTFGGLALLVLASCKKDGAIVTVDNSSTTAATLTSSATSPALTKATLTVNAVTFTTTAPKYSYNAAYTNTLQIAVKGTNFASPKEVPFDASVLTKSFNVQDFNNILLALNMPSGTSGQVEVRVKSSLSSTAGIVYSNVVTLTATPFALVSYLYVPGAYQSTISAQQWIPATADSLQSPTGNGIYTGVINFTGSGSALQFKITPVKTWDNAYGLDVNGNFKYNPNPGYAATGGNLMAATKATVDPNVNITSNLVTVDLNQNTIALTPTLWSVVGDATPGSWPNGSGVQSDTDLKYNNGTQTWSTKVALTVGALKFRLNHDWGTNYGSATNNGILDTANNNNIPITVAGTYLITLDINKLTYTVVKQ